MGRESIKRRDISHFRFDPKNEMDKCLRNRQLLAQKKKVKKKQSKTLKKKSKSLKGNGNNELLLRIKQLEKEKAA